MSFISFCETLFQMNWSLLYYDTFHAVCTYRNTHEKKKKSLSSGLQIDDLWNFTSCLTLLNSQFFGFLCCLTPYSVFALHLDSLSQSKIQILYSCSYVTLLEVGFIAMVLHIMAVVKLYLSFMPCPLFYKVWSGMMYHWHS